MKFRRIGKTTYSVDRDGNVRNKAGTALLRPGVTNSGYLIVILHLKNRNKARTVHSLVAQAWLGPRPEGFVINHKDGNRKNNNWKNLEYVTGSGNMKHASDSGLLPRGSRHYTTDLTEEQVARACRLIVKGVGNKDIGDRLGIKPSKIRDIRMGKSWKSVSKDYFKKPVAATSLSRSSPRSSRLAVSERTKVIRAIQAGKPRNEIAEKFGISPQMVSDVKAKRTWKDTWSKLAA